MAQGIANELKNNNIPCFGPTQEAAKLESDKDWSKAFMNRHNIPTARWKSFTDNKEAKKFVSE